MPVKLVSSSRCNINNFTLGDYTERTLMKIFAALFSILFLAIFSAHKMSPLKAIAWIHEFDFIPISGGIRQTYSGGIITMLYIITVGILISGVIVSSSISD